MVVVDENARALLDLLGSAGHANSERQGLTTREITKQMKGVMGLHRIRERLADLAEAGLVESRPVLAPDLHGRMCVKYEWVMKETKNDRASSAEQGHHSKANGKARPDDVASAILGDVEDGTPN